MSNLNAYNNKRNFKKTNEPVGHINKSTKKLRFVVQHHVARKDHYDLRLEVGGVMKSWAVPKGPSYNTKDKRLAIEVEDHPISYRNFEGVIPKGQYGAGTVMVWDNGTYSEIDRFNESYKKGYLKFELFGKKLKGKWTLVRFKDENWLLVKENDDVKGYKNISSVDVSVKSGKNMDDIANNGIEITSPEKVVYTRPKVLKKDIVDYYGKVYKRMAPYLNDRILSTVRCPDGVKSGGFFKKHFDDNKFLKSLYMKNDAGKRTKYFYINSLNGLLSEAQMNSIEFHISGSSIDDVKHPNMLVFDLDPDSGLSISKIREGVKDLKSILDKEGLTSFLKTSGGKGYHVVVPIPFKITWKKLSTIAETIAKIMEEKWPEKYTSTMSKRKRKGKIFIDWFRNSKSASCVAPYSLRARSKATVSMPIKWSELDKVRPDEIDITMAIKRLKRKDPWEGFFASNSG